VDRVLIIGATGNIGRELAPIIHRKSVRLRVVSRSLEKLSRFPVGIERVACDLNDASAIRSMVAGVDKIFTLAMPGEPEALRRLVDAAASAQVRQVVLISSTAPDDMIIGQQHRISENILTSSGLPWTILRPGSLMSNALWWRQTIQAGRAVYSAVAHVKQASISPLDVAKAAAISLSDSARLGMTYTLKGTRSLSDSDKTAILSRVLNRLVSCVDAPLEAVIEGMKNRGVPEAEVFKLAEAFAKIIELGDETPNDELEQLLGEKPQSFEEWCLQHVEEFR